MDFPAIEQVVTFSLPHPKLGEEVAAAVALREGQEASERDIRDFAATRMADFKVPRKVVILDEIPKGATGKMQRIGMAEKLGLVKRQDMMKICVFGAGAIGGYMGVKLAQAGADVSLVARGPHLTAMQQNGLRLVEEEQFYTVSVTASDTPEDLGEQDYVIVTLKAHSVPLVVEKCAP